jgi:predicted SAM-dependent methyltransferase
MILSEVAISLKSRLFSGWARRILVKKRNVLVNIGCGDNPADGWINLDIVFDSRVTYWDCRRGLPFEDASVKAIFTEHFLEHLDYKAEAPAFLRECWRCLQVGGVLRVIVPDAGLYLRLYQRDWDDLARTRPLVSTDGQYKDYWLSEIYETKMELINSVFRQNGEHKYAYDVDTLVKLLEKCGFAKVVPQAFGKSSTSELVLDRQDRARESLYVEAIK